MEIKIGDYVRSEYGSIGKVTKIKDYAVYEGKECITSLGFIVESSPRIFDIIKVGDYVNGEEVKRIYKSEHQSYLAFGEHNIFKENSEEQIKTVLTKEIVKLNLYKVR